MEKEKKKKVIRREVVIGYGFAICEKDKKGNLKEIDSVTIKHPTLSAKTMKNIEEGLGKTAGSLIAYATGKVTESYEMDLDFFVENARKVDTESEGE